MSPEGPRLEMLPLEDLDLDIKNPRIAKWIEIYGDTPPPEAMELALGVGGAEVGEGGPSFVGLKQSIMTHRGIIHPIIVLARENGRYLVIEGNTRTQIYRILRKQEPGGPWRRISALVYDRLEQADIDSIRLQAHLVGIREWDPYSKAKYLDQLRNGNHLTMAQIVDFCGGDAKYISRLIDAFNDMEDHYRPLLSSDADFDASRFSGFVELQGKVLEAVVATGYSKDDFANWIHKGLIHPLNTVRKLPSILHNREARDVFFKKGAMEAIRVLDVPPRDTSLEGATLMELAHELIRRWNDLKYPDMLRLRQMSTSDDKDVIRDARDAFSELYRDITMES